jgi:hypothetical protein
VVQARVVLLVVCHVMPCGCWATPPCWQKRAAVVGAAAVGTAMLFSSRGLFTSGVGSGASAPGTPTVTTAPVPPVHTSSYWKARYENGQTGWQKRSVHEASCLPEPRAHVLCCVGCLQQEVVQAGAGGYFRSVGCRDKGFDPGRGGERAAAGGGGARWGGHREWGELSRGVRGSDPSGLVMSLCPVVYGQVLSRHHTKLTEGLPNAKARRIVVPLSGATNDIAFLAEKV